MPKPLLRIITRSSPLAIAQTHILTNALAPYATCEIITTTTTGDAEQTKPLFALGGKNAFCGSLEKALIAKQADIAVHSLKDLGVMMNPDLTLGGVSPRANAADLLIFNPNSNAKSWEDLPTGAKIGTSSLRRQGLALAIRPDLQIINCRGNIATRLAKLVNNEYDALILAACGLERLQLTGQHRHLILPPATWTPAPGAAIIGYQCRDNAEISKKLLSQVSCTTTMLAAQLEREIVRKLGAHCHWPLAILAHPAPLSPQPQYNTAIQPQEIKHKFIVEVTVPYANNSHPLWNWQTTISISPSQEELSIITDHIYGQLQENGIMTPLESWPIIK